MLAKILFAGILLGICPILPEFKIPTIPKKYPHGQHVASARSGQHLADSTGPAQVPGLISARSSASRPIKTGPALRDFLQWCVRSGLHFPHFLHVLGACSKGGSPDGDPGLVQTHLAKL